MDLNLSVFQEPRGVMRILQFIFSICAFATTTDYAGSVTFLCKVPYTWPFEYPFNLMLNHTLNHTASCNPEVTIIGNYSSDAQYFVATGVIAMLYSIAACILYVKYDEKYRTNTKVPLADFLITVFIAVLWLSSSASWANGISGLSHAVEENIQWTKTSPTCLPCGVKTSGMVTLSISDLLGFLNFFLWAADLWFLYKETSWFQNRAELPGPN